MRVEKNFKIKETIITHIKNNKKEYFIVTLIFIIGIFLGVLFMNNIEDSQFETVKNYLNQFIQNINKAESLDYIGLIKNSIINYSILAITIWFFGTTVIGIPIVFGIILYRGFCLGYTIAACMTILESSQGMLFIFSSIFLQNIIIIPVIIALAVSGIKLYKSIIKDRRKDNIKLEIVRHTIFSAIMLLLLCIAAIIEIMISTNILKNVSKYFIE